MFELDEAQTAAALRELAIEDQAALDEAVDATAGRARGRSPLEIEAMLRTRLRAQGVELGEEAARLAEQMHAAAAGWSHRVHERQSS